MDITRRMAASMLLNAYEDFTRKPLISKSNSGQMKRAKKNRERHRDEAFTWFMSDLLDDTCKIMCMNPDNIRKQIKG